ncbi:DUF4349 domain-containing protein [Alkalibacterium kapii]|uniref:DUF4349 domain-containing protein n=1 Tax=Alkalibacterium kapii TaxID=426704 RepID=A0A511AUL7_9LACT|nr:DUF4349 domain-containing protein [Alkalibacterium kapii]GEK91846.1 hypothetical protein AKA01nite_14680 [Alkalibacterium kapii]
MGKKRLGIILLFFLMLSGCAGDDNGDDMSDTSEPSESVGYNNEISEDMAIEEEVGDSDFSSGEGEKLIGDKVIRRVQLEYETLDFQKTTTYILDTVSEHDGYIEYSNESSYSPSGIAPRDQARQYRQINYLFRIPTDSLDIFLKDLKGMDAYKLSENIGAEDITQSYRDTESRINILEKKEARLNELLEQAESIEAILEIENSLSETIAEREELQSRLNTFDDLIDYTEVHLTVVERPRIANTRGEGLSFWERISEAFVNSFYAFYYFIQDAFIWLIYAIPFILILAVLVGIGFYIRKIVIKNRKK